MLNNYAGRLLTTSESHCRLLAVSPTRPEQRFRRSVIDLMNAISKCWHDTPRTRILLTAHVLVDDGDISQERIAAQTNGGGSCAR